MNKEKILKLLNKLPNSKVMFAVITGIIIALIVYLVILLLPLR